MSDDLSQFSMHDLFRLEVEGQREVLTGGLLQLERAPDNAAQRGETRLDQSRIDLLLRGLDLLVAIANTPEAQAEPWQDANAPQARSYLADLAAALAAPAAEAEPLVAAEPVARPKPATKRRKSDKPVDPHAARERRGEAERRADPDRGEEGERRSQ